MLYNWDTTECSFKNLMTSDFLTTLEEVNYLKILLLRQYPEAMSLSSVISLVE